MKDLYTFDMDNNTAMMTYEAIHNAYSIFFNRLGVPWRRVKGDCGDIGGQKSHEYHFPAAIGQDTLLLCSNCDGGKNTEFEETNDSKKCPDCGGPLVPSKGIEVGHTFLLGDTYSSKLKAKYITLHNSMCKLHMGCYGIGVSRLIGACVEALSNEQELRWPKLIAPFSACVICPKLGSREESAMDSAYNLYDNISNPCTGLFPNDVILDDRDKITVGKKLRDAYKLGYPYIILFGKSCLDQNNPQVELHSTSSSSFDGVSEPQTNMIPLSEIQSVLTQLERPKCL